MARYSRRAIGASLLAPSSCSTIVQAPRGAEVLYEAVSHFVPMSCLIGPAYFTFRRPDSFFCQAANAAEAFVHRPNSVLFFLRLYFYTLVASLSLKTDGFLLRPWRYRRYHRQLRWHQPSSPPLPAPDKISPSPALIFQLVG